MAKKLNKLVARVEALERAIAKFLGAKKPGKTAKKGKKPKAKPEKATGKKSGAKKSKAKKSAARSHKPAAQAPKAKAESKPRKKQRVPIPTIEQLAVSGEPQFVTPLDRV